jgi:hypothetical protein
VVCVDVNVRDEFEEEAFARLDAAVGHGRRDASCPSDTTNSFYFSLKKEKNKNFI